MEELTLKQKIAIVKKTKNHIKNCEKNETEAYLCWALNKTLFKENDDIPASLYYIEPIFPEMAQIIKKNIGDDIQIANPFDYRARYKVLNELQTKLEKKLK